MAEEWCLIESDPGVFTEMIKGFGALALRIVHIVSSFEGMVYPCVCRLSGRRGGAECGRSLEPGRVFSSKFTVSSLELTCTDYSPFGCPQ